MNKVGGAELNFAIACARLGLKSKWISRLGNDKFGRVIYNFARGEGLVMDDDQFVEGHPTSLNFKEIREDGSGKNLLLPLPITNNTWYEEDAYDVKPVDAVGAGDGFDAGYIQPAQRRI